jgi:hypothetical protein
MFLKLNQFNLQPYLRYPKQSSFTDDQQTKYTSESDATFVHH